MKTLKEMQDEIRSASVRVVDGQEKIVRTFSKSAFDDISKALMNDTDYETTVYKTKAKEVVKEKVNPAAIFRNGMLKRILLDAGVDKHEAEEISSKMKISNVDGFYELVSESVDAYLDTGKKFTFMPKEDFTGSLVKKDVAKTTKEHRIPSSDTGETVKIQTGAHKTLRVKNAGCPAWLKKRV